MTWTGHVARDLTGELRHSSGDVIQLCATVQDAMIYLEGTPPEQHWRGEIAPDRKTFRIGCPLGFVIHGSCKFEGGRYVLTMTQMLKPDWALLPGENANAE